MASRSEANRKVQRPKSDVVHVINGQTVHSRFVDPAQSLAVLEEGWSADLAYLEQEASKLETASRAENTRRAYRSHWNQFQAWCQAKNLQALPADPRTIRLYITDLSLQVAKNARGDIMRDPVTGDPLPHYKVSSIKAHLSAIGRVHFDNGWGRGAVQTPEVVNALSGLARLRAEDGERPDRRVPLLLDDVRKLIDAMDHSTWPDGVAAARDTFALLFGFATALRRDEQAPLLTHQVRPVKADGLHVVLFSSKTDQEGEKDNVLGVPYGTATITDPAGGRVRADIRSCAICAYVRWARLLQAWQEGGRSRVMRLVFETPPVGEWTQHICRDEVPVLAPGQPLLRRVFRSGAIGDADAPLTGSALYEMLKRRLKAAGYDPDIYGWHSLRAGHVTQARANDVATYKIRRQTRHATDAMVDTYDRQQHPLANNSVTELGM